MSVQPDDPYLYLQWYIDRGGTPGAAIDLDVRPVWDGGGGRSYTGAGVHVGIFDSRIDRNHPDLESNYDASLQLDTLNYNSTASGHGTAVAGIIAAAKNGVGMTGIAYDAHITSMPVSFSGSVSLNDFGRAMAHARDFDVINMSFGGVIPFDLPEDRATLITYSALYRDAAENGRGGLGTILVQAAGNSRADHVDSNLSRFQSQRYNLVVAAIAPGGIITDYSSEGANVLVSAPSTGDYLGLGVATTDRLGIDGYNTGDNTTWEPLPLEYTLHFGGTSAAAPMITGIVALMLEANPELGWRDVRDILAITARHAGTAMDQAPQYQEKDFTWSVNHADHINGAGLHFSQNYGFGLADARAAVRLAETWTQTRTSENEVSRQATVTGDQIIPDAGAGGPAATTINFTVAAGVTAQNVTLYLDLSHAAARELEVQLISPSGTQSILFLHYTGPSSNGTPYYPQWVPWTFNTNQFMGEDAGGLWHLVIRDNLGSNATVGVFHSATLTVYGDAVSSDNDFIYTNEFGALAGMSFGDTVNDTTGTDTLNASAVSLGSTLDLRGGRTSTINGHAVTLTAATVIENAWGGDGSDRIGGNGSVNRLEGLRGNDQINGREGDDIINGGAGDDIVTGGAGNDTLDGGPGFDRLSYADASGAILINLNIRRQDTGSAGVDLVTSFENVEGSDYGDRIGGSNAANSLWGRGGDDILHGHGGNDQISGGGGNDRLDGDAGHDQIRGDEGRDIMNGGAGKDTINGDEGDDTVNGGEGDDLILGSNGADRLDGGDGIDTISYAASWTGLTIDLSVVDADDWQSASGGDAESDRVYNFENVIGTRFDDLILGDNWSNTLNGGDGRDGLGGFDGNDVLNGGAGTDTLNGGTGDDILAGGSDDDWFYGGEGTDRVTGGAGVDWLLGGDGNDAFIYLASDLVVPGDAVAAADHILDFHVTLDPGVERDRIDLRPIDAIAGGADDAFTFIGQSAFTAAGQVRVWFNGADTVIEANTVNDPNGHVELAILLAGINAVGSLSLFDFAL